MDEAKRFLRFVLPGSTTVSLLLLYLWIAGSNLPKQALDLIKDSNAGISMAVGVFLGSGVLGYLLSVVHHTLFHSCRWYERRFAPDMRRLMGRAIVAKQLKVLDLEGVENSVRLPLGLQGAMMVGEVLLSAHQRDNSAAQSCTPRIRGLWDLLHASGTVLIGSVAALAAGAALFICGGENVGVGRPLSAFVLGLLVICALCQNLKTVSVWTGDVTTGLLATMLQWRQDYAVTVVCDLRALDTTSGCFIRLLVCARRARKWAIGGWRSICDRIRGWCPDRPPR